jgi:tetratricopeptide (TPR) repeat protein
VPSRATAICCLAIAIVSTLVFLPHAAADNPWSQGVSQEAKDESFRLYDEANKLYDQSRYAEANEKYREALALWEHPSISFNLGQSLYLMGELVLAHESFTKALRYDGGGLEEHVASEPGRYLEILSRQLVSFSIGTEQKSVVVLLDGKQVLVGPGRVVRVVQPGPHVVVASKKGMKTRVTNFDARAGKKEVVDIVLMPPLKTRLRYSRRWPRYVPWVVSGAGLALLGAGVPLMLESRSAYRDFDQRITNDEGCPLTGCVPSPEAIDIENRAKRYGRAAFATYALGATTLAAGVVMVYLNRVKTEEIRMLPSVGSKSASLLATFSF